MSNALTRGASVETTDLATTEELGREMQPGSGAALAQFELQGAMTIAKRFPRNEDGAFGRLMQSCRRHGFADEALYSFPRGSGNVEGLSIYFAREAARLWGNIRYGLFIVSDDDDVRHIRGWAWDLETNTKVEQDDVFKKLIQRKNAKTKVTEWVRPDERDMRELTNRRGAIAVRNCILQLLPEDLKSEAEDAANATLNGKATDDPELMRKSLVTAYVTLGIQAEDLEKYLKHPLGQTTAKELTELRKIYKSIKDGNSIWSEYVGETAPAKTKLHEITEKIAAGNAPDASELADAGLTSGELFDKGESVEDAIRRKAGA